MSTFTHIIVMCVDCWLLWKKAHTELVGLSTETQSKLDELLPECAVDACRRQWWWWWCHWWCISLSALPIQPPKHDAVWCSCKPRPCTCAAVPIPAFHFRRGVINRTTWPEVTRDSASGVTAARTQTGRIATCRRYHAISRMMCVRTASAHRCPALRRFTRRNAVEYTNEWMAISNNNGISTIRSKISIDRLPEAGRPPLITHCHHCHWPTQPLKLTDRKTDWEWKKKVIDKR